MKKIKKDAYKSDKKTLLLSIVLLIIIFSMIFKIGSYIIEMFQNEKYVEDLQELVLIMDTEEINIDDTDNMDNTEHDKVENTTQIIVPKSIDFTTLYEISDNVVAWIYDPGMKINYVIAQATDNDYYLRHQLNGKRNKNGTIFMDYRNDSDFSDWNTLIHGHNMKSGAMFASLKNYCEPGYYEEHPVMYLYVPGQRYKLELLFGYTTTASDAIYQLPNSKKERDAILDKAYCLSTFESNIRPEETDRLVTLSTCSHAYDNGRYVVVGRLVAE